MTPRKEAGMSDAAHPPALEPGTQVKVRGRGTGEMGVWRVIGPVASSTPEDPAYDVAHTSTGRRRVFRASRLLVVRQPVPG
jgi:hypothetical protein